MLDTTAIDLWLAAYLKAWRSDSPEDIVALFESHARYFTAPFREPYVGHDAIVTWWTGQGDSAVAWSFDYDVIATNGPLYVIKGVTTYPDGSDDPGTPETFDNIWLVTLTENGTASEFVEYWMLRA